MKNTNLLFALVIGIILSSCGQQADEQKVPTNTTDTAKKVVATTETKIQQDSLHTVEGIQRAYAKITELLTSRKLDSTSFKYSCDGEKSGTVKYFYKGNNLQLIVHRYAEYDHYEAEDRFYVNNNVPFFAHLKGLAWSFDNGPEGATRDKITENRIYLADWQAIKCLQKKYEIRLHAGVNPKPAEVPNRVIDCSSVKSITKSFNSLIKYWKTEPPTCLSE